MRPVLSLYTYRKTAFDAASAPAPVFFSDALIRGIFAGADVELWRSQAGK